MSKYNSMAELVEAVERIERNQEELIKLVNEPVLLPELPQDQIEKLQQEIEQLRLLVLLKK